MLQVLLTFLFALAALVAILDWFGIKPNAQFWGNIIPLRKSWKLILMLGLVAASLGMSGYTFYRALHPKVVEKIVEKPVERIVEKLVPADCPRSSVTAKPPVKPAAHSEPPKPAAPSSQSCPNGVCIGGENSGTATVNNFAPPERHLNPNQVEALNALAASLPDDAAHWFTVECINVPEAITFGDEIQRIFKNRGKTNAAVVIWISGHPPFPVGIVVAIKDDQDEHFQVAQRIANSIMAMDLPKPSFTAASGLQPGQVKIIVGTQ